MSISQKNNIELAFIQKFYDKQISNVYSDIQNSAKKIENSIIALERLKSNLQSQYLQDTFQSNIISFANHTSNGWQFSNSTNKYFINKIKELINYDELSLFYEIDDMKLIKCYETRNFVCLSIIEYVFFLLKNIPLTEIKIFLFIAKHKVLAQIETNQNILFTKNELFNENIIKNIISRINYLDGSLNIPTKKNNSSLSFFIPNKKHSN